MIYTVTLNPSLDRTLNVDGLRFDDANRIQWERRYPGGKGINVSHVIAELGGESIALGLVGGYTGEELKGRLRWEGVSFDFTQIEDETRTNIIIYDQARGTQTELNARGPRIKPQELDNFLEKLRSLRPEPSYVVMSGSIPPGVPKTIYKDLISLANSKGARAVLDADGELLEVSLQAEPFIIKPNVHELGRLCGRKLKDTGELLEAGKELKAQGLELVLISRGGDGLLALTPEGIFSATSPPVEALSTVGAGDSALAAFVLEHSRGSPIEECLKWAAATGAATALTPGVELCRREDVHRLLGHVRVERL
ncbi:MAG: 1-phosphofructokinase [Nitrospinota bacterium]